VLHSEEINDILVFGDNNEKGEAGFEKAKEYDNTDVENNIKIIEKNEDHFFL
jgi:hypothetical protein